MFSKDLEVTIGHCYKQAREQRHEFMTVEHLLLALTENQSALGALRACGVDLPRLAGELRSEEHTSELQSLMRISYAVFCLKKKKKQNKQNAPATSDTILNN